MEEETKIVPPPEEKTEISPPPEEETEAAPPAEASTAGPAAEALPSAPEAEEAAVPDRPSPPVKVRTAALRSARWARSPAPASARCRMCSSACILRSCRAGSAF